MAYTLQALITDERDARNVAPIGTSIIPLSQCKALVPLNESVRDEHGIAFLPLTDGGDDDVPDAVKALVTRAKKIAYVEAEFFGGDGAQASAVWEDGRVIFGPVIAIDAINQALRVLGVTRKEYGDEFEALDLGRHRDTNDWK